MSAAREEAADGLSEQAWQRLLHLETLHRQILRNHERVLLTLDEVAMSDDRHELLVVWNQYRAVVADLSRVTGDIGSLRLIDV
jgi:hypothetical protein